MYLDISNLSAEHVKNLKYNLENVTEGRNKLGLIKALVKEGIEIPKSINVDKIYLNLQSSILKS